MKYPLFLLIALTGIQNIAHADPYREPEFKFVSGHRAKLYYEELDAYEPYHFSAAAGCEGVRVLSGNAYSIGLVDSLTALYRGGVPFDREETFHLRIPMTCIRLSEQNQIRYECLLEFAGYFVRSAPKNEKERAAILQSNEKTLATPEVQKFKACASSIQR